MFLLKFDLTLSTVSPACSTRARPVQPTLLEIPSIVDKMSVIWYSKSPFILYKIMEIYMFVTEKLHKNLQLSDYKWKINGKIGSIITFFHNFIEIFKRKSGVSFYTLRPVIIFLLILPWCFKAQAVSS